MSAEPNRGVATVWASLVDASTNEVLRQTTIEASPGVPVLRTLTFPSYGVPDGQRLALQLQVATFETRHVIYGLAPRQAAYANASINGASDSVSAPLAFVHVRTGNGLRAAILGEPSGRIRLILAVILSVLAGLGHPRTAIRLRKIWSAAPPLGKWLIIWARFLPRIRTESDDAHSTTKIDRILLVPWYPWPAAAVPILHFLANNHLHFAARDAIVPLGVVLAVVTGSVGVLKLFLKDWHRPAAVTTVVTALFFAYGHIDHALAERVDERVLFGLAVVLGVLATSEIVRSVLATTRATRFLNLTVAILLAFPVVVPLGTKALTLRHLSASEPVITQDIIGQILPEDPSIVDKPRPDIYYIILDAYGRHDALGDFDNSAFLKELEDRGFYIAYEATSNYKSTLQSISSSLNMSYLNDIRQQDIETDSGLLSAARYNALATVLKSLGYTYVHFSSGALISDEAPLADMRYKFTPAGVIVDRNAAHDNTAIISRTFLREIVSTTALGPLVNDRFLLGDDTPFIWYSPQRTLQMFDALKDPIQTDMPKFVFAHFVKPHRPATFDQYGNFVSGSTIQGLGGTAHDEFGPLHDRDVPDAYVGQLIYINSLVLDAVDGILRSSRDHPIIVIAADHGRGEGYPRHAILAAFHLPGGGDVGLYPSISSVNHFRYILDYYFDIGIGLVEDVTMDHDRSQSDPISVGVVGQS